MLRPSWLRLAVMLVLLLVCPVGVQAASSGLGQAGEHLVASLDGRPMRLDDVARHHCHDLELPVIRCFRAEKERNADFGAALARGTGRLSTDRSVAGVLASFSVTYVICYDGSNYLGPSLLVSNPVNNLGSIGWNNRISSFKSTNGGRPKWWDAIGYAGTPWWQWASSAWVPYVGDALNDRFTSVQNVP